MSDCTDLTDKHLKHKHVFVWQNYDAKCCSIYIDTFINFILLMTMLLIYSTMFVVLVNDL